MCADGRLLTSEKIRAYITSMVQKMQANPEAFEDSVYMEMAVLALCAYHGHRQQDYLVGYRRENRVHGEHEGGYAYYDPETATIHLHRWGKTGQHFENRQLKVHTNVTFLLRKYHEGANHRVLFPTLMSTKNPDQAFRDLLKDRILGSSVYNHGFPVVTHTVLRHLFEFHVRYIETVPYVDYMEMMHIIGHSEQTALTHYNQKCKALLEHPLAYGAPAAAK